MKVKEKVRRGGERQREREGEKKGSGGVGGEGRKVILINIVCFDVLWPWNWTALSKHSGLEGAGLFSVLPPTPSLCFAHRQAVFVL